MTSLSKFINQSIFSCYINLTLKNHSMNRLQILKERIKQVPPYIDSAFDYLSLDSFLTKQENDVRLTARRFVEAQVVPKIGPYVQQAKFPEYLLPLLKEADLLQYFLKPPYGTKLFSTCGLGAIVAQFTRGDAGVGTMFLVQWALVAFTIQALGSEEQKAKYLPKLRSFEYVGGWGLTEQKIGSDASNLQSAVQKTGPGTYKINGTKRWIGNGNRDLLVIWARNTETKEVEGYILENKNSHGLTSVPIKNKLSLRIVQNCHITLNNVVVKQQQKLPKATSFSSGTNVVLKHSRIFVCWAVAGVCLGIYDNAIKYVSNRKQFGAPITKRQLVQEKMFKVMSTVQAILLMCFRISQLVDEGKATIGQIAMTKAWVTDRARDVARWGREVYGGNGIIHDNYAMKALADIESMYTYEGTYDINVLVAGRQITGLSAFK